MRTLDEACGDPKSIDDFAEALIETPSLGVTGTGIFAASSPDVPFVLTETRSAGAANMRRWSRWPLHRLFPRMKPTRIAHPAGFEHRALAVPLRYGRRRCVVVAPLSAHPPDAARESFFSILESVTIPYREEPQAASADIPASDANPRIVAFALCDRLRADFTELLRRRGWPLQIRSSMHQLYNLIAMDPDSNPARPDLIIVDLQELNDPIGVLRMIRHADAGDARVFAFESATSLGPEGRALADVLLPHSAGKNEIFAALKSAVQTIPESLNARFERRQRAVQVRFDRIHSPDRLAAVAAGQASEIMAGWAGVALLSPSGALYRAEQPQFGGAILSSIPAAFLDDRPLFCSAVDQGFMEAVFDDARQQQALSELSPISAAAIPLISGRRRLGLLLATSRFESAPAKAFEALERLARSLTKRFGELTSRASALPQFTRDAYWQRWSHDRLDVAVYRSAECAIPWHYRPIGASRGILVVGMPENHELQRRLTEGPGLERRELSGALAASLERAESFASLLDGDRRTMLYATHKFPPPLVVGEPGPHLVMAASRDVTTGSAALEESRGIVICNDALRPCLDASSTIEQLRELLEEQRPSGFASLLTLSSQPR
ncbi:MAG: hypothetical protein JO324_09320 [Candidatus Eremiobacteraeota bacterium]|nr:hypothetical protein [Candidatus Eremiobacteraeota bacterium]